MTAPRFDPASYPGPRASGPVLIHRGEVSPLRVDAPLPAPLSVAPVHRDSVSLGASVLEVQDEIRWSVAYGSNASPERLIDKGLDAAGAILLPARMVGWVPAFEARRTGYGAVPLTLVPRSGAVTTTWLLGLPADHLDELDRTEGRIASATSEPDLSSEDTARYAPPGSYRLGRVGDVAVADRFVVRGALAYLPGPRTVVQHTGTAWRSWPEHDQTAAAHALDDPAAFTTARTAPDTPPVLGPWPHTPFEDLPLFVYGTLQPGEGAWDRIGDLVEVAGPATVPGRLWDTGKGWPALTSGRDGEVLGTLLTARDATMAAELLALTDAYEGVPDLFRRLAVRVRTGGSRGGAWALTYVWAANDPPGLPVASGRWEHT